MVRVAYSVRSAPSARGSRRRYTGWAARARLKFNSSTNPRLCGGSPAVIGCHLSLSSSALASRVEERACAPRNPPRTVTVRAYTLDDRFARACGLTDRKGEDSPEWTFSIRLVVFEMLLVEVSCVVASPEKKILLQSNTSNDRFRQSSKINLGILSFIIIPLRDKLFRSIKNFFPKNGKLFFGILSLACAVPKWNRQRIEWFY